MARMWHDWADLGQTWAGSGPDLGRIRARLWARGMDIVPRDLDTADTLRSQPAPTQKCALNLKRGKEERNKKVTRFVIWGDGYLTASKRKDLSLALL